jgi:hypothetical protein
LVHSSSLEPLHFVGCMLALTDPEFQDAMHLDRNEEISDVEGEGKDEDAFDPEEIEDYLLSRNYGNSTFNRRVEDIKLLSERFKMSSSLKILNLIRCKISNFVLTALLGNITSMLEISLTCAAMVAVLQQSKPLLDF